MTSPIKLENHQNRQQHLQNQHHGSMVKNLHLSEVITTAAAVAANTHHYNGIGLHRHSMVDPTEMTILLNNITTNPSHSIPKIIPTHSNIDQPSRLNHFSWEELEGRYLPVIFRNENNSLQRYTSKMYVENILFQSDSWQRFAMLARSLPPLISFPYTEHELKLFRLIVEWHLASLNFKTILPSDCLIRFEDLLEFYGELRKLRDSLTAASYNRAHPAPPPHLSPQLPSSIPMNAPKQRMLPPPPLPPSVPSSPNVMPQSFELPTMTGNGPAKAPTHHRQPPLPSSVSTTAAKVYPLPHSSATATKVYSPPVHHPHSSHYLLQQNADLAPPYTNPTSQTFNYGALPPKVNVPLLSASSNQQWNDNLPKPNDKARSTLPRPIAPMNNIVRQEQLSRDKQLLSQKLSHPPVDANPASRETKDFGWVQINNVFVPYIVKLKLRDGELEKCTTRQPPPQLQREIYVPYEILLKCHIFSDTEFAFKKFLIKATQQDFDTFNSLISNINIFDEKVPERTLLVNLYHVMIGLPRILYVKLLTTKQPRTQVNKYHAEVLVHKGGALLMHENRLVPYILQNNRFYVPLIFAFRALPHIVAQAKRGARAPRQYEIDYLNLLLIYFSIDSVALTSDTLLVDAFSIKSPDLEPPIHFRTLAEHQQHERNKLLNTLMRIAQANSKIPSKIPQSSTKSSVLNSNNNVSTHKSTKYPPANVVVNPLIHHPSFYGLSPTSSSIKSSSSTTTTVPSSTSTTLPNSVVVNPRLVPSASDSTPAVSNKQTTAMKTIKYNNRSLNVHTKSSDQSINDSKISIRHIFEQFSFNINYEKFIQWCQTNLLLPLLKLDDDEKLLMNKYDDDYYVNHNHLERCVELLNDLERGTISMTLLPSSNSESSQQQTSSSKCQLAGAKKRKTTIPTTRHILPAVQSSSPSLQPATPNESNPIIQDNGYSSPGLPIHEESLPSVIPESSTTNTNIMVSTNADEDHNNNNSHNHSVDDDDSQDLMPVVAAVEEEQPIPDSHQLDRSSSLIIIESNDCDDGKIHLDDTLPSCSSGYESAAPVTSVDINMINNVSSDEDETNSTTRSREHSSSCHSEQSHAPILSTVSTNIALDINNEHKNDLSPVISNQKSQMRRDKHGKFRARSRSPTPRAAKKKRSYNHNDDDDDDDDDDVDDNRVNSEIRNGNTITSDRIEYHLRTLSMSKNEQRRTGARLITTPKRLIEETPGRSSSRSIESDINRFDTLSNSSSVVADTPYKTTNNESTVNHQSCTYNVTISNKPNKLGLTIKKVVQR